MNYNKNDLIDTLLIRYYATFARTLDTSDYVPDKFNCKILKYIFKNMKRKFREIDKFDKKFQAELRRKDKLKKKNIKNKRRAKVRAERKLRREMEKQRRKELRELKRQKGVEEVVEEEK